MRRKWVNAVPEKKGSSWLPWILVGIGVIIVIGVISSLNSEDDEGETTAPRRLPEREAPAPKPLEQQVRISGVTCGYDEARGSVTNNAAQAVDVFVDVQFLDGRIVIGDSLASISGLRPGETGRWEAPYLGDSDYDSCRADVSSVFGH